ncbi:MAG: hypothetical protein ACM3XP_00885, partial [Nitrososphaerales archaeon]
MHKSEITAVFVAAILLAGAKNVASPTFIINDAIDASDEKEKKYNYNMHEKNANNEYDLYDESYENYKQNYKDGDSEISSNNEVKKNGHVSNKVQNEENQYNIDSYSNNRDSEDKEKSYTEEKEYKDDYKKDDMREYDKYKEKEYKDDYKKEYKKEYKDDYKKDDMREYDKYKEKLSNNYPNLYDRNDNYEKVYNEFSTNIDEIKLDKSTNKQDDTVTSETEFSQKQKQNDYVSQDIPLKTDDRKVQKENLRSNIASNIDSNNNEKIRTNSADEDPVKLCDDCYLFYMDFLTRDEITITYTELINTLNEKGANLDQLNTQNEIPLFDSANLWEICEAIAGLLSSDDKSSALSGLLISWANNIEENIANYEGTPRNVNGENIGLVILAIINCIAEQNNVVLQVDANGLEQAPSKNSLQKQEQPLKLQQQQKQKQQKLQQHQDQQKDTSLL